jgi:KaiC/GvpD/RAD55 family RecA-like ATPase
MEANSNIKLTICEDDKGNPVSDIIEEVEKSKHSAKTTGVLKVASANAWLEDAAKRPNPKCYFLDLIVENEITVIFGPSNSGKSILAVQIAEEVSRTEDVCYIDLEMSDKQFQMRYTDKETGVLYGFPERFSRAELDLQHAEGEDIEREVLDSVELLATNQGIKFFIIDNMTPLCREAEKSAKASEFMVRLQELRQKCSITIIVMGHTPKRRCNMPITQDDLSGSSKLMQQADAGIAFAKSAKDGKISYLKQVKVRTSEYKTGEDNVMLFGLTTSDGHLHFEQKGYAKEIEHLMRHITDEETNEIFEILKLQSQRKSYSEIAKELGITKAKVQRRLDKAKAKNITLSEDDTENTLTVSDIVSLPIQTIRDTDLTSSNFEEED